jgi:hypothetical protein
LFEHPSSARRPGVVEATGAATEAVVVGVALRDRGGSRLV